MPSNEEWSLEVDIAASKVGMLRYTNLSVAERQAMRAQFESFRGKDTIPTAPVVSKKVQENLQRVFPQIHVPLEPFARLLTLAGFDDLAAYAHVPASEFELRELTSSVEKVADAINQLEQTPDSRTAVRNALTDVFQALSGEEPPLPHSRDLNRDLIIAFGARRKASAARAELASRLFNTTGNPMQCRLIVSGWHPYYARKFEFSYVNGSDDDDFMPFGEAEAMAVTVEERVPGILDEPFSDASGRPTKLPRLVIDPRARNTLETIVHSLPIIHETRQALGRPLNVFLVTSPYHVRRTFAIATSQLSRFLWMPDSISTLVCCSCESAMNQETLINPRMPRHGDAIRLYIRESIKLMGGRLTGEF